MISCSVTFRLLKVNTGSIQEQKVSKKKGRGELVLKLEIDEEARGELF